MIRTQWLRTASAGALALTVALAPLAAEARWGGGGYRGGYGGYRGGYGGYAAGTVAVAAPA